MRSVCAIVVVAVVVVVLITVIMPAKFELLAFVLLCFHTFFLSLSMLVVVVVFVFLWLGKYVENEICIPKSA